jgi:hypothetical protein
VKIEVRYIGSKYADVTVRTDNTVIELGLYTSDERKQFADYLREIAEDLSPMENHQ